MSDRSGGGIIPQDYNKPFRPIGSDWSQEQTRELGGPSEDARTAYALEYIAAQLGEIRTALVRLANAQDK